MSGLVKGIGKVFKKVGEVVSKIWKPVLIATAAYFTAGLALQSFSSTQAFGSALPGWGADGMFTNAAKFLGLGGLGAPGSSLYEAVNSGAGSALMTTGSAVTDTSGIAVQDGGQAIGADAFNGPVMSTNDSVAKQVSQASIPGGGDALAQQLARANKLALYKMGIDFIGGLTAPTLDEQYTAQKQFRGAFYGAGRNGVGTTVPGMPPPPGTPSGGLLGRPRPEPKPGPFGDLLVSNEDIGARETATRSDDLLSPDFLMGKNNPIGGFG